MLKPPKFIVWAVALKWFTTAGKPTEVLGFVIVDFREAEQKDIPWRNDSH